MSSDSKSIVAVSNGGWLLGQSLGSTVDKFAEVIRFNDFKISGHIDDVGAKTTIWSRHHGLPDRCEFLDCRKLYYIPLWRRHLDTVPDGAELIPHDVENELMKHCDFPVAKYPTTGLITIAYLLSQYETIHLCGWFQRGTQTDSFLSHYFRDTLPLAPSHLSPHDLPRELSYIQELQEHGRLQHVEYPFDPPDFQ